MGTADECSAPESLVALSREWESRECLSAAALLHPPRVVSGPSAADMASVASAPTTADAGAGAKKITAVPAGAESMPIAAGAPAEPTTGPPAGCSIILTDMESPAPDTPAGQELLRRLALLRNLGATTQLWPRQKVSALAVPTDLMGSGTVFLAGSPANHDPHNNRIDGVPCYGNAAFKEAVFYSLAWYSREDAVVALTYSASACGSLDFRTVPWSRRAMLVIPVWFRHYQPRLGLADSLEALADDAASDTMLAIFAPAELLSTLQFRPDGRLDAARTLAAWARARGGPVVTFGAYTAELEQDVAEALAEEAAAR